MFVVNEKNYILMTRGDIGNLVVTASQEDGSAFIFHKNDIVRLTVVEKNKYNEVLIRKDIKVAEESDTVVISLSSNDTRFGPVINKPVDYYYEVEVNPETSPQTIIGHDENGPKIFRLYPEGGSNQ